MYCENCGKHIDTDFDAEHFEDCIEDTETDPKFLAHIAMCLDLGLDPENPNLAWVEYPDETPWFTAWQNKQHDSDIDMRKRDRFNPKIKGLPQIPVNNIVR